MRRLILLTEPELESVVAAPFRACAELCVAGAATLDALAALLDDPTPTRVLSVGAKFIVPPAILARMGPAYNLHPGPPEYPGIFPSVFALYHGAMSFGVTLHEMAARVDSGPIIAVDRFPIQSGFDRLALDTATFAAMRAMIARFAAMLVDFSRPLRANGLAWAGPTRTRKEFESLCRLPEDVTVQEFHRRYRALGEGPDHAITLSRFGREFRLVSHSTDIVRAGQPLVAPAPGAR
jgi:methionyl-tRNA formyltransferase